MQFTGKFFMSTMETENFMTCEGERENEKMEKHARRDAYSGTDEQVRRWEV